jgi:hypothetical protein
VKEAQMTCRYLSLWGLAHAQPQLNVSCSKQWVT